MSVQDVNELLLKIALEGDAKRILSFISDNPNRVKTESLEGELGPVYKVSGMSKNGEVQQLILKTVPQEVDASQPSCIEGLNTDYRALTQFNKLCPASSLKSLHISEKNQACLVECIDGYESMKERLVAGHLDKVAIQKLARTIGVIHRESSVLKLNASEFQSLQQQFKSTSLHQRTAECYFHNVFDKDDTSNRVAPELKASADQLYNQGRDNIDKFQRLYTEKKDCLVHGNLSPHSVVVKDIDMKIADCSYAYVGPASLDLAMLVAHFIIAYHQHMLTPVDNDLHRRVSYKCMDAVKDVFETYMEERTDIVDNRDQYFSDFTSEVAGFAGIELIARTIGKYHAKEIESSGSMEKEVFESGVRLLRAHGRIDEVGRLLMIGLMLC